MSQPPAVFHPSTDIDSFAISFALAAFAAAFVAMLPMPYAFYMGLKGFFFIGTVAAMGHTLSVAGWRGQWWLIGGAVALVIYNPFVTFEFSKGVWTFWNFAGAFVLLILSGHDKRPQG